MRTHPDEIDEDELAEALACHWGIAVERLDYLPEGGGAYHWIAVAGDGSRRFVTCDDLGTKPWFGSERELVLAELRVAYASAVDLRAAGLDFVVAPTPTPSGQVVVPFDARHSLAVFPFVEGAPGRWGEPIGSLAREQLLGLLSRLHTASLAPGKMQLRQPEIAGRRRLERALDDTASRWQGGPFSERVREELARKAGLVATWLVAFDELGARVAESGGAAVITHGEPHAGNLILRPQGLALVDWDTIALARPERDLWMLDDGTGAPSAAYEELTGRAPDPDAMRLYRLGWALADLADFTALLRGPHGDDADSRKALNAVLSILGGKEPAPFGPAEPPADPLRQGGGSEPL